MNSITDLLDLEDSEIIIKDIQIQGQTLYNADMGRIRKIGSARL